MASERTTPTAADANEEFGPFIGGEWRDPATTRTATNPATGDPLAEVGQGTREEVREAISAAREVQPELASWSAFDRADLCHDLADAIEDAGDHLAAWLTADQGKPLAGAEYEVHGIAELFRTAAEDVKRLDAPTLPSEEPDKHVYTMRQPHGVYGCITPWNFPLTIPGEYLAPALATGNAVVWVPAPSTSVISAKLMEVLAEDTDLPAGAVNLVTGEGPVVGDELVREADAIGFTGSPETGETIASAAGAKPTLLEMGGNGPVVVCADADLEAAVDGAASSCFTNAGQVCSAGERILVHESVADEFTDRLAARAEAVTLGDPTAEGTDMGPLNNEDVAAKMDRHLADARERGAEIVTGGGRAEGTPTDLYYRPTVARGITEEMAINSEESFGPVAPVMTFSDHEEAIEIANGIDLGLTCGVFTSNLGLAREFAERIQTGVVNVNDASTYWERHTPFGGFTGKNSGVGRLGGKWTLEEVTQVKNVIVDTSNVRDPEP